MRTIPLRWNPLLNKHRSPIKNQTQTVGIYSYELELLHEITIPETALYAVNFTDEMLYYAAEDAVMQVSYTGKERLCCELNGLTLTQLHCNISELFFVGKATDASCYGRIPMSSKEITYQTRDDGGTDLLPPPFD